MIGSLRGRVIDRDAMMDRASAAQIVIEVAGVGYRVAVTPQTLDRLPHGGEVLLHIHHHIREADQKLYGFLAKEERVAFEGLLAAHGVGPALALAVLTTHPADRLARILAEDDLNALCQVPGVGRKTAQRLLVELRSSLVLLDGGGKAAAPGIDLTGARGAPGALADVREALANLGYSPDEVKTAMAGLPADVLDDPAIDGGQLLKQALRVLAGG
ncbi:MAG: Holliday junction branch migration protein RuvA [Acidimicrobiia bacterium]|nr:Holliday junction branch migration protein RuvA [Acidimicrobiia bacterium]